MKSNFRFTTVSGRPSKGCNMELFNKDFAVSLESFGLTLRPFRVRPNSKADQVLLNIATPREVPIEDKRFAAMLLDSDLDFNTEPASIYNPEKLKESILKYFEGEKVSRSASYDKKLYELALNDAVVAFKPKIDVKAVSVTDYNTIIKQLQKDTSSGFPYFKRKDESYEYAFTRVNLVLSGVKSPNPCVSFFRTQRIHGESNNSKVRLVWGEPMEMTIIESLYARPLIDYYLNYQNHPVAFGLSKLQLNGKLTNVLNSNWQYSLDYSQFDSRINSKLLGDAFRIMLSWVTDVDENAEYIKERIITYALRTPLLTPWGLILGKRGGINSGNYFTQLIGSFCNYFFVCYLHRLQNLTPHRENINVLGDDSAFGSHIKLNKFNELQEHFGIKINVDKSHIVKMGNTIHFLGRYYRNGLPHGDPKESRTKLVYPERNRNVRSHELRLVVASYLLENVENASWINPMIMYGRDLTPYLYMKFFNDKSPMDVDSRKVMLRHGAKAGFVTNLHRERESISLAHGLLA